MNVRSHVNNHNENFKVAVTVQVPPQKRKNLGNNKQNILGFRLTFGYSRYKALPLYLNYFIRLPY